jgi:hypothetical protein
MNPARSPARRGSHWAVAPARLHPAALTPPSFLLSGGTTPAHRVCRIAYQRGAFSVTEECRRRARACLHIARTSKGSERILLLDMAQTWLRLARRSSAAVVATSREAPNWEVFVVQFLGQTMRLSRLSRAARGLRTAAIRSVIIEPSTQKQSSTGSNSPTQPNTRSNHTL